MPRRITQASIQWRVDHMPYGIWCCRDGRKVLFNRRYQPIWQRMPGELATPANRDEWVRWAKQRWFYHDGHTEQQAQDRAAAVLAGFIYQPYGWELPHA